MSHPIETPTPGHGWTPERKTGFLDRLAVHGNARAACRAVGLSAEAAYKLRRRDPLFARAWAAALVLARENGIQVLGERAIEGVEEEIFYRGELIGTRRRYDSRLLLAHLARLDQLADEESAGADAGRFDELVACIAQGAGDIPEVTREQYIEDAAKYAEDRLRREEMDAHYDALGNEGEEMDASSYWKHPVDEDFEDELDRKCKLLADRTREAAAKGWDRQRAEAWESVDALIAAPEAHGAAPAPSPSAILNALGKCETPPQRTELSFPCTLSTVSTTALARTLAEPPGRATIGASPSPAPPQAALLMIHTKTRSGQSAPQAVHGEPPTGG